MVPKFRAWDIKYKMMMRVNQIDFEKKTVWLEADNGDHENRHTLTREFKDVILLQSTGLKDKNSVEIYCGDVVEWLEHRGVVEFVLNNQQTMIIGASGYITDLDYSTDFNTEVIGNIHENPKILGQANEI
ncbi:YopX family protein [Enterococcus casseliflavus]|uniref:YopX family protein n=1 Tax=Enterococcus casseliflavus TaxID=37734 RepID=UPI0022FD495C|nr:YopX family protein [Enterococcus casseliflavus]WBY90955.1 YopX family protein [Enterococcus casseliflavus]